MTLFGAATLVAAVCAVGVLIVVAWYEVSSRSVEPENERPSEAGAAMTFGVRAPNGGAPIHEASA